jgi:hypothetical protein
MLAETQEFIQLSRKRSYATCNSCTEYKREVKRREIFPTLLSIAYSLARFLRQITYLSEKGLPSQG